MHVARRDDPAVRQHDDVVARLGREVEVVQRGEDGDAVVGEVAQHAHRVELRGDVEVVGRLVEQQERGLLREGAREVHALALAAGERRDLAVREPRHPDARERRRASSRSVAESPVRSERCGMRPSSTASSTESGRSVVASCSTSASTGPAAGAAARAGRRRRTARGRRPGRGPSTAAGRPRARAGRGLPGAVRAEQPAHRPRGRGAVDAVEDEATVDRPGHALRVEPGRPHDRGALTRPSGHATAGARTPGRRSRR